MEREKTRIMENSSFFLVVVDFSLSWTLVKERERESINHQWKQNTDYTDLNPGANRTERT